MRPVTNSVNKVGCCCAQPVQNMKKLTFADGTQIGVLGLDEIFAAVYEEGREANAEAAREIVDRLETRNYIPSSARREYEEIILKEYKKYVADRVT